MYFIVDLVWVAMVPICVKSPGVIIKVRIRTVELPLAQGLGLSLSLVLPFTTASLGSNAVFVGSYLLSRISLVHGFHLIGRNKHVVFDYAEGRF